VYDQGSHAAPDLSQWVGAKQLVRVLYREDGKRQRTFKGQLEKSGTDQYVDLYLYDESRSQVGPNLIPIRVGAIVQINIIEHDGTRASEWVVIGAMAAGLVLVLALSLNAGSFLK